MNPRSAVIPPSQCRIVDNISESATVWTSGESRIEDTSFVGNNALGWGCGAIDPDHGTGCVHAFHSLIMERCLFDDNIATDNPVLDIESGVATVRNSIIRHNRSALGGLFMSSSETGLVRLEDNLFIDNSVALVGPRMYWWDLRNRVEVVGNTFARNADLFRDAPKLLPGSIFDANVFTGSNVGFRMPEDPTVVAVICNDSWGNDTNWIGINPLSGGNFSEEPKYCAPLMDDFFVASNSPLLPANNACGVQVGAFGAGCGPVAIEVSSWGRVKAAYR